MSNYIDATVMTLMLTILWFASTFREQVLRWIFRTKLKGITIIGESRLLEIVAGFVSPSTYKLMTCIRCLPMHFAFWSSVLVCLREGEWAGLPFYTAFAYVAVYLMDILTPSEPIEAEQYSYSSRRLTKPERKQEHVDAIESDLRKKGIHYEKDDSGSFRIIHEPPSAVAHRLFMSGRPHCPAAKHLLDNVERAVRIEESKTGKKCPSCLRNRLMVDSADQVMRAVRNGEMPEPTYEQPPANRQGDESQ